MTVALSDADRFPLQALKSPKSALISFNGYGLFQFKRSDFRMLKKGLRNRGEQFMDIFVLCVRYFATKVGLKTVKKCLLLKSKMLFFFLRCYKPKRDLKKLVQKIILSIASVLKSRSHVITLLHNLFAWLGYHLFYCYCF